MRLLRIALSIVIVGLLTTTAVDAGTWCNSNGGKGICCITTPIDGDGESEEICIDNAQACAEAKPPKDCDYMKGSSDYCACKTLQACDEACGVASSGTWQYAGKAVADLYNNCSSLVKKFAGDDGYKDLKLCFKTDKIDYKTIQKNCGEFVKDYCSRVTYEN